MNGKKFTQISAIVSGTAVVAIIAGIVIFWHNMPMPQEGNNTLTMKSRQSNSDATNVESTHTLNPKQLGADPEIVQKLDQLEGYLRNASDATKKCVNDILDKYGGFSAIRSGQSVPDASMSTKLQTCFTANATQSQQMKTPTNTTASNDKPPLLLKSIGVNLDYYDAATGRAGDFVFSTAYTGPAKGFDRPFMGFGFIIPAANSSTRQDKVNPQPTFILPLGTKVHAIVDGIVAKVPVLYSGDYSIMVNTDGSEHGTWAYETEHVIHPLVKVGDHVTAGQVIAEVSNYMTSLRPGYGIVELGILHGGATPEHLCPFAYLDPSIKEDTLAKIKALETSWEAYVGDSSLYDQGNETIPGCVTLDQLQG